MAVPEFLLLSLAVSVAQPAHQRHDPILIQNQPSSPDKPLIIEGYEISNPDGPGIQVRDTDYVVIRNNFLHDCGTKVSEQRQRLIRQTGDARKGMLDKPFETGAILVFDAKGTVEVSGNEVHNNDYGIMVQGHRFKAKNVSVHDNNVQENHRAAFIWVGEADSVDNRIHDNRVAAFVVWGKALGRTVLNGNEVANNGGNPIHFQFYDDYDMRAHPEDWEFDGEPVLFKLVSDEQMAMFEADQPPIEERGDDGKVFLLVLFVSAGLLLTVLSIPMVFRKIPPNQWYGFRVRATLENAEVWYPANEYAGKRLFWVGVGTMIAAAVLFLLPITNVGVYASAVGGIVMVGLAVAVIQSFLYLRTLTEEH